jgi:hypothetical protein
MKIVSIPLHKKYNEFAIFLQYNIYFNNFVKIKFIYGQNIVYMQSIYGQHLVHICLLVARFECWSPNIHCIVTKGVKLLIYHNYTRLFYKSNFNIFFLHLLLKWNKWKSIFEPFFQRSEYIWLRNIQNSKPFKGKHIWIFLFNSNSENISSWEKKYDLTRCNIFLCKKVYDN